MTDAKRARGTMLQMGDGGSAGAAKTLTSSAIGTPYTTIIATGHGFFDGQPVTIAGVTGTGATQLNGPQIVRALTANLFAVKVTTTGAGSGGTATPTAESFVTVAHVGDVAGPQMTRTDIDVTDHGSPGEYDEFISGIKSSGEVTFPIHWIPDDPTHDNITGLFAAYADGAKRNWRIVVPDYSTLPSYLQVYGYVNEMTPAMPVVAALTSAIKIKVFGAPLLVLHGSQS